MEHGHTESLLQYWRHPHLADGHFQPLRWRAWLGWIGAMLLLSFLAMGLAALAIHLLGHTVPRDRFIDWIAAHPSWRFAATLAVGPVIEELSFRCFISQVPRDVVVGFGFLGALLAGLLLHALMGGPAAPAPLHDVAATYFINLAIMLPIAAALGGLLWWLRVPLQRGLRRRAAPVIVLTTLFFAALHSFNFGEGFKPWLLWLTLPQLMAGTVLVYVRVRHGLRASIATHLGFDWLLLLLVWTARLAHAHGGVLDLFATVTGAIFFAVLIHGTVFLFRRGVLRAPLPEPVPPH